MHIEVSRKPLLARVKMTTTIAREGDNRPILRNALIEVTDKLEISVSNGDVNLWQTVKGDDVNITRQGRAVVSALNLRNILESTKTSKVELFTKENMLYLVAGGAHFKMVTEPANEFPKLYRFFPDSPFVTLKARKLIGLISRVSFCAHNEQSHYNMHGVLVRIRDKKVTMVATNGQRLGVASADFEGDQSTNEEVIVPARDIKNIDKLISSRKKLKDEQDPLEAPLDLQLMRGTLSVRGDTGEVTLRTVKGKYPPFEIGVPKNSNVISLDRESLLAALKQATAFQSSAATFMTLQLENGKLTIRSRVRDAGSTLVEQEVDWQHEPISIILNPDFLLETTSKIDGDNVRLEVEKVTNPTLLREDEESDIESFCVFSVVRQ